MTLRFPDLIDIDAALSGAKLSQYGRQAFLALARSYHTGASTVLHDPIHGGPWIQPKDARFVGTLSGVVNSSSGPLLLSNRHVFYENEFTSPSGGALWHPISPPGSKGRIVGYTKARKVPAGIIFSNSKVLTQTEINRLPFYYDAAVASITVPYSYNIPGIGIPTGHVDPKNGMSVILAGGKSGVTHGKITNTSTNYKFPLPDNKYAYVKGAFVHSCKSTAGDSGSLIVETATKKVVGLHYAGDDNRPEWNIGCRASAIASAFGINFVGKQGIFNPPGYTPPPGTQPPPSQDPIILFIRNNPMIVGVGGILLFAAVLSSAS